MGEVVGIEEVGQMAAKLFVAVVVIPFDRGILDRAVHAFDLAIGPWMVWLGQAMLDTVQAFHDKHDFKNTGGEELAYRVALMTEELGEISSCVTKGKDTGKLAEECADLLILVLGTAIAADFDLNAAFWSKMKKLEQRDSRMINGRIRVSEFRDM